MRKQKTTLKKFKIPKAIAEILQVNRKWIRAHWCAAVIGLILAYTGVTAVMQFATIYSANSERDEVIKQIEAEKAVQQQLREECEQLQDRQYIEQIAREELGLVKEGEIPFISRYKKTN